MDVAALVIAIVSLIVSLWVGALSVRHGKRSADAAHAALRLQEEERRDTENRRKTTRIARSLGKFYEDRWKD